MRSRRSVVTVLGAVTAATLTLAGCTTAVSGSGRPAAAGPSGSAASAGGSPSSSPVGRVPSGAPPATGTYPNASPEYRSYLFARDASYAATILTAKGALTLGGATVTVDGVFGFDAAASELSGTCSLAVGADVAQVRSLGDTVVAQATTTFWTAVGVPADAAAAANGRWVAITAYGQPAAVCANQVAFLTALEPGADDALQTSTENDGRSYLITDPTTGYTTVADHAIGRITEVRSAVSTVAMSYPGGDTPPVTLPAAAEIVSVPGF